jgi:hypothetical protein
MHTIEDFCRPGAFGSLFAPPLVYGFLRKVERDAGSHSE